MTIEGEYQERYRGARERLMGIVQKPKPPLKKRSYIPPMEPPEPKQAVELPRPTQERLDAILNDDEIVWRTGVKMILKGFGENLRRLVSHQRDQHIIRCRKEVASYLRARGWSYPRIGEFMHRDHSSIVSLLSNGPARVRKPSIPRPIVVDEAIDCTRAIFGAHGWVIPTSHKGDAGTL